MSDAPGAGSTEVEFIRATGITGLHLPRSLADPGVRERLAPAGSALRVRASKRQGASNRALTPGFHP